MARRKAVSSSARTRNRRAGPRVHLFVPSSRVIVKFRDDIELPYDDRLHLRLDRLQVGPWRQLMEHFPGISIRRMFTAVAANRIRQLVDRAVQRDSTYRPPNFLTYVVIGCPIGSRIEELVRALLAWPAVQNAYVDPPGEDPTVNANDDPRSLYQGYLDLAPDGIDAEFAWSFTGGDGAGQDVIDLEQGWTLDHEDLAAHGAVRLHGGLRDSSRPHGTCVLGAICAVDNALGGVGIAPNVRSVNVVSYWESTRPDAILAAINSLPYGGVLLLEAQLGGIIIWPKSWPYLPIEFGDAEFDVIRLATALGLTVVEAAGNGDTDLDTVADAAGRLVFKRGDPGFRDSGAVLVGAATSAAPHTRTAGSNYGSRIDCYAWGENVDTCTSTTAMPFLTDIYTAGFDGTSSAAAIITGGALIVQGIAEANLGYRFSGFQVRGLLSNPTTGTASMYPAVDRIGVMPDLRAIINSNVIGLAPDVYVRDHVGDKGDRHTGAVSASPDIILRPVAEPNPQAAFGQGSGTENSDTLGAEAIAGQNNSIYVRVRNRGGSDAANVRADVYWSPVASLITPDLWAPVGSVLIPNVPAGNVLTVSNAITWLSADIPNSGHYCFVGLIGNALDPAPIPADLMDWSKFQDLIRDNNNVTWRNFNVIDNEPDAAADPFDFSAMAFLAPGAPDRARWMRLEVDARLPVGSRALLEMPRAMYDELPERSTAEFDRERQVVRVPVNPHGLRSFGDMLFPARSRSKLRLLVQIPAEHRGNAHDVFVRQVFDGLEVGRVTWRLARLEVNRQRRRRKGRGARG